LAKGGVTFKNAEKVAAAIKNFAKRSASGTREGLTVWGHETMTIAKRDFVPVEFGTLMATGTVEEAGSDSAPEIVLSFGGDSPAGAYAIPVHERPARHSKGSDKFLQTPAQQESKKLLGVVGQFIRKATGL